MTYVNVYIHRRRHHQHHHIINIAIIIRIFITRITRIISISSSSSSSTQYTSKTAIGCFYKKDFAINRPMSLWLIYYYKCYDIIKIIIFVIDVIVVIMTR